MHIYILHNYYKLLSIVYSIFFSFPFLASWPSLLPRLGARHCRLSSGGSDVPLDIVCNYCKYYSYKIIDIFYCVIHYVILLFFHINSF